MLRRRAGATTAHNDGDGGKEAMATAEECRAALESLTGRIAEMDAKDRAAHLLDRTLSCRVPDLGITFLTRLSRSGAEPIRPAESGAAPAQVRFTADSDVVVAIAADPGSFMRAWLTGKLKVQGSVFDLLHLRKLM
jgi:SCP-2 sterol transfer family